MDLRGSPAYPVLCVGAIRASLTDEPLPYVWSSQGKSYRFTWQAFNWLTAHAVGEFWFGGKGKCYQQEKHPSEDVDSCLFHVQLRKVKEKGLRTLPGVLGLLIGLLFIHGGVDLFLNPGNCYFRSIQCSVDALDVDALEGDPNILKEFKWKHLLEGIWVVHMFANDGVDEIPVSQWQGKRKISVGSLDCFSL